MELVLKPSNILLPIAFAVISKFSKFVKLHPHNSQIVTANIYCIKNILSGNIFFVLYFLFLILLRYTNIKECKIMKYQKPELRKISDSQLLYCSNGSSASGTDATPINCQSGISASNLCIAGTTIVGPADYCSNGPTDDHPTCGTGGGAAPFDCIAGGGDS